MLYRYEKDKKGKLRQIAKIYTFKEHPLKPEDIEKNARYVIETLSNAGFRAYVVGGAVRDLLSGKKPKDFDIVTNAYPNRIRKIFRHSHIIGRRFRLVHVFSREKIIEVSTFRSDESGPRVNIYGTMAQDARRRDFSLNALYYCPKTNTIIDYVGGFHDIKRHRIRMLGSAAQSFIEDPVRMIRAVKYSSILGYKFTFGIKWGIYRQRNRLSGCSRERLKEEFFKILKSGHAYIILKNLYRYGLMDYYMPVLKEAVKNGSLFWEDVKHLDRSVRPDWSKANILSRFCGNIILKGMDSKLILRDIEKNMRGLFHPLIIPKNDIHSAAKIIKNRNKIETNRTRRNNR